MKGAIENENNSHQSNDQAEDMTGLSKAFSLIVCLKPEDDVPHPRHFCFKYPFTITSPKKHCSKCYCYVCEEIAPCRKWSKPPSQRHCEATEKEKHWSLQRQLRIKLPGTTLTMAHHKLYITTVFEPPGQFIKAFAGGLICNGSGDWISGFSMRIHNNISAQDSSVSLYTALLEGLKLSWSQGFRHLHVHLGFLYHDGFWYDFKKNSRTKKFQLTVDASSVSSPRIWAIMKDVDDYLSRDWFIGVKKTGCFEEETSSFGLAVMAYCKAETKREYNFTTYRLTAQIKDIVRDLETENTVLHYYCQPELRTSFCSSMV